MKKKILAVALHPGATNTISPVIKKLKNESVVDVITIGQHYAEQIFKNQNVNYKTVSECGLEDVSIGSMESLLEKENPSLILMGVSEQDKEHKDVIEQTTTFVAGKKGIPSIMVLEWGCKYENVFSNVDTETNQIIEPLKFLPDRLAVLNEYFKNEILSFLANYTLDRRVDIVVTGNPYSDNLESKAQAFTQQEKLEIKKIIGLPNFEQLFFYAANATHIFKNIKNYWGFWDLDNIKIINEVLIDLPEEIKSKEGVVIKLHPRIMELSKNDLEDITRYVTDFSSGNIVVLPPSTTIQAHSLILASDVLFTPFSTLAIEALYMKKPCISLQPDLEQEDHLKALTESGIIPVGYKREDCKSLLKRAFSKEKYRQELIQQASKSLNCDGKATERVTNLIYETIGV